MTTDVFISQYDSVQSVLFPLQAHTHTVTVVEEEVESIDTCDALITSNPRMVIGVHTRDCAPICFGDASKVAVAHVGWRGLCGGIIENVLSDFGEIPKEVFVGPFLHSFEVQRDACYEAILAKFGVQFLTEENGILIFHYKNALASLLPVYTRWDERNTAHDITLPSHRHKRTLGHIITTVQLKREKTK